MKEEMNEPIILASSSPRRKRLLEQIDLKFDVIPSNIHEEITLDLKPSLFVEHYAYEKANHIANLNQNKWVIGADTIVVFEENVGTPTLNTDIIASISRNGGSNFTTATLSDSGYVTGSSGQRILTGAATISGQPSGQSMRWKLALANNTVKIHGVALQWS